MNQTQLGAMAHCHPVCLTFACSLSLSLTRLIALSFAAPESGQGVRPRLLSPNRMQTDPTTLTTSTCVRTVNRIRTLLDPSNCVPTQRSTCPLQIQFHVFSRPHVSLSLSRTLSRALSLSLSLSRACSLLLSLPASDILRPVGLNLRSSGCDFIVRMNLSKRCFR